MTAKNRWAGGTPNNPGYPQRQIAPTGYPIAQSYPTVGAYPAGPTMGGLPQVLPGNMPAFQNDVDKVYNVDKQRYANFAIVNIDAPADADLIVVPKPDARRVYLLVVNKGSQTVWVNFGTGAGVNTGLSLEAGGFIELNNTVDQQDVHVYGEGGASRLEIVYGNRIDFEGI